MGLGSNAIPMKEQIIETTDPLVGISTEEVEEDGVLISLPGASEEDDNAMSLCEEETATSMVESTAFLLLESILNTRV